MCKCVQERTSSGCSIIKRKRKLEQGIESINETLEKWYKLNKTSVDLDRKRLFDFDL